MKKYIVVLLSLLFVSTLTACNSSDYKKADGYLAEGKYDAAIEMFEDLGSYKDSADRVIEAKYQKAENDLTEQNYDDAYSEFEEIKDYLDAADRMKDVRYAQAESFVEKEDLETALSIFQELGNYSNAAKRAAEVEEMMKIHATAITFGKNKLSLTKGKVATLTAVLEPSDTTDVIECWTSSDESVATVKSDGTITAIEVGAATISAKTSNGLTASCVVTVVKPSVAPASSSTASSTASTATASDKAKAKIAYNSLKNSCKFPDTLKIYNVWAFDSSNSRTKVTIITIEYSAQNNLGQNVRKYYNAIFEGNTLTMSSSHNSIDFSNVDERNLGAASVY